MACRVTPPSAGDATVFVGCSRSNKRPVSRKSYVYQPASFIWDQYIADNVFSENISQIITKDRGGCL